MTAEFTSESGNYLAEGAPDMAANKQRFDAVRAEVGKVLVGQDALVESRPRLLHRRRRKPDDRVGGRLAGRQAGAAHGSSLLIRCQASIHERVVRVGVTG